MVCTCRNTHAHGTTAQPARTQSKVSKVGTRSRSPIARQNTISSRLKLLVNDPPHAYLNSMCLHLKHGEILPEDIRVALNALEDLRMDARTVEDNVLQQEGVGGAFKEAHEASKSVHEVISAVEEIFFLLFDIPNLMEAYSQGNLLFQQSAV
ncbi:hypothetical protein F4604DRAFT_1925597 [Suillus subluteus]|nr:hypothetical protein F4604DRAFT_1925597 [Suillus subluteus]